MSLINEALKQARVEAARQDAAGKGVPPEALPRYVPQQRRSWLAPVVGFVAGLVAVGVAAGALWMVRGQGQDVSEGRQAQHAPEVGQAPHAAEGRQAAHASGERQPAERGPEREPARQAQATPATRSKAPTESRSRIESTPPPPPAQVPAPTGSSAATERVTEARSQAPPAGSGADADAATAGSLVSTPPMVATEPVATVPVDEAPVARPSPTDGPDDQIYLRQAAPTGTTVKLDFIVWSEDPFAQINGHLLSVGQSVDGYTLLKVEHERVELEGGGERFWIRVK